MPLKAAGSSGTCKLNQITRYAITSASSALLSYLKIYFPRMLSNQKEFRNCDWSQQRGQEMYQFESSNFAYEKSLKNEYHNN